MTGQDLVRLVQQQLVEKGIPKGEFYKACGITSTAFSNWRNGQNKPSEKNIKCILDYLGISESDVPDLLAEAPKADNDSLSLRELLRDRQDLRILLNSAKDVPASSVYSLIAQIEKMKEEKG